MNILWMVPKNTLPATDGARVATERLIKFLQANGACIHYLCICQSDEDIIKSDLIKGLNIDKVSILKRALPSNKISKIFYYLKSVLLNPLTPITFSSFNDKRLKNEFNIFLADKVFDIVLLDGLHLGSLFINNNVFHHPSNIKSIIYRAHNIEADLWKNYAAESNNLVKKMLLNYQAKLVTKWEQLVIDNVDGIAPISREDLEVIHQLNSSKNLFLTPIGLNFSSPLPLVNKEMIKLYFIGKMDWAPNKEGLKWFLEYIWPTISSIRDDISLHIVGSGDKSWLADFKHLKNINIIGFIEDIRDAYADASLTIVPIHFGSGTRIKVIETYANKRGMISTTLGAQGSDLLPNEYCMANTKEEWIELLLNLKIDNNFEEMVENSYLKMANLFSDEVISTDFYNWLKTFK